MEKFWIKKDKALNQSDIEQLEELDDDDLNAYLNAVYQDFQKGQKAAGVLNDEPNEKANLIIAMHQVISSAAQKAQEKVDEDIKKNRR